MDLEPEGDIPFQCCILTCLLALGNVSAIRKALWLHSKAEHTDINSLLLHVLSLPILSATYLLHPRQCSFVMDFAPCPQT
jgi:hypothetical protein